MLTGECLEVRFRAPADGVTTFGAGSGSAGPFNATARPLLADLSGSADSKDSLALRLSNDLQIHKPPLFPFESIRSKAADLEIQ